MIIGAGLAGLISAHAFPHEAVVESQPEPNEIHKALLRFRSKAIGEMTGIEFKPVIIRKGIWYAGFKTANIMLANMYAQKVVGEIMERSIWNLDSATRYIAPVDFYERLIDSLSERITWGTNWIDVYTEQSNPIISTAPMAAILDALKINIGEEFKRSPITVQRFQIDNCNIYQTIYYPAFQHSMYRASITGDFLICEFSGEPRGDWFQDVLISFNLSKDQLNHKSTSHQKFGKIVPINENKRRATIVKLTAKHNIFSVGRFATWRNILLDDVVHDIAVVKELINATEYERRLIGGQR